MLYNPDNNTAYLSNKNTTEYIMREIQITHEYKLLVRNKMTTYGETLTVVPNTTKINNLNILNYLL